MKALRTWLAEMLAPDMARDAARYHWIMREMHDGYRWLGEFDQVIAFLEWMLQHNHDAWRGLQEKPWGKWPWYGDISQFREQLRRKFPKAAA